MMNSKPPSSFVRAASCSETENPSAPLSHDLNELHRETTRRVLVIDLMTPARSLMRRQLSGDGWVVCEAESGEAALDILGETLVDLVITAHVLSDISGLQLCRLLRADPAYSHIPILLITSYDERRIRAWARYAGAEGFLTKSKFTQLCDEARRVADLARPSFEAPLARGTGASLADRLRSLLDDSLLLSAITADVRNLSRHTDVTSLFKDLVALVLDHVEYQWLAVHFLFDPLFHLSVPIGGDDLALDEARAAFAGLGVATGSPRSQRGRAPVIIPDERATHTGLPRDVMTVDVLHAGVPLGHIAIASSPRGFDPSENRFIGLLTLELGPALRVLELLASTRRFSHTDALTGLANRRGVADRLTELGADLDDGTGRWSVLLINIDHFKRVNDELGHDAGDIVLVEAARHIIACTRGSDICGRWGAKEFILFLSDCVSSRVNVIAERIRAGVESMVIELPGGGELRVTVSVGTALGAAGGSTENTLKALMERAAAALYQAKQAGRNQVVIG